MVMYEVASSSATSKAITVATLTFGQAQLLLGDATALQDEILAIAAVAVCGNGICELGERPNSTAAAVNATGETALRLCHEFSAYACSLQTVTVNGTEHYILSA